MKISGLESSSLKKHTVHDGHTWNDEAISIRIYIEYTLWFYIGAIIYQLLDYFDMTFRGRQMECSATIFVCIFHWIVSPNKYILYSSENYKIIQGHQITEKVLNNIKIVFSESNKGINICGRFQLQFFHLWPFENGLGYYKRVENYG